MQNGTRTRIHSEVGNTTIIILLQKYAIIFQAETSGILQSFTETNSRVYKTETNLYCNRQPGDIESTSEPKDKRLVWECIREVNNLDRLQ